jgi:putative hydrolase of the HAD superfamily
VEETLASLRAEGLRLGALSDFPLANKLPYLGLREKFECVACSEDSGYLKPNPEPFLRMAECLSVQPEHLLYVGNNYAYDIVGAHAAGMRTAHLSRRPVRNTVADLTFSDYRSLKQYVLPYVQSEP